MIRLADQLVQLLELNSIDCVFGMPGVHNIRLYDALGRSSLQHVGARNEQNIGFMLDGYFRSSGKLAAGFVITGPGLTNCLTSIAQAAADSSPMFIICTSTRSDKLGGRGGNLHELGDQNILASACAKFSQRIHHPNQLADAFYRALAVVTAAKPGPAVLDIPLDLLDAEVGATSHAAGLGALAEMTVAQTAIDDIVRRLDGSQRPLILAGGGARHAAGAVREIAKVLDAPCVMTANGRGALPKGDPLAIPASPSLEAVRQIIASADVVLAVGTEMGPTDYEVARPDKCQINGELIRIDIDVDKLYRDYKPDVAVLGNVSELLPAISASMLEIRDPARSSSSGAIRAKNCREAAWAEIGHDYRELVKLLNDLQAAVPDTLLVGDSTQLSYAGNSYFAADGAGSWFNGATGFGSLGFAIPAAIGAHLATKRHVFALVGDGGAQFSINELATAVDCAADITIVVWENNGYAEIKTSMQRAGYQAHGTDIFCPDYEQLARAYGVPHKRMKSTDDIAGILPELMRTSGPKLLIVNDLSN